MVEATEQLYWIPKHPTLRWGYGHFYKDHHEHVEIECKLPNSGEQTIFEVAKPLSIVHPSCLEGQDNLLDMGDFSEAALLQNVRGRFQREGDN